jgi:hypothetical protein
LHVLSNVKLFGIKFNLILLIWFMRNPPFHFSYFALKQRPLYLPKFKTCFNNLCGLLFFQILILKKKVLRWETSS